MRDELHNVSQLGKTLTDIGGTLESVKTTLSLSGESGSTATSQGTPARRCVCFLVPPIPSLQGRGPNGTGSAIVEGFKALREKDAWTTKSVVYAKTHSGTNPYQWATDSQLDVDGTFAINQCRPTTPAVDLATSVAELISEGGMFFRLPGSSDSLAGEWLNYNLAISPTIATVKDLHSAMKKQDDIIAQYERDAGRLVRRQYAPDFWHEKSSERGSYSQLPLSWDPGNLGAVNYVSDYGTMTYSMNFTKKRWFSGAFTYPRPEAGWRRTLAEFDRVYGIIPGPDTLWELMPYSFVADYFANMGDVLANASSFAADGLVMPYGYIMQQKIFAADVEWVGPVRDHLNINRTVKLGAHIEVDVRQRRAATPFGFGFSWGSVTPRQLSIVAALGLSRV